MPWASGSKKSFVEYFEHFFLFLVDIAILKITLLNFAKFYQHTPFYLFIAQDTKHFFSIS